MENVSSNKAEHLSLFFFNHALLRAVGEGASDLYLQPNVVPMTRTLGRLSPMVCYWIFDNNDLFKITQILLTPIQALHLAKHKSIDILYVTGSGHRTRIHISEQHGEFSFCIRFIKSQVPTLRELGLQSLHELTNLRKGLVLVGGTTGSGKSTTLAALAKSILDLRGGCLVSVEDPIEYILQKGKGWVIQNEVGRDVLDVQSALKGFLRQNPDIVFIGELRDRETIEMALNAAEAGHLVLSSIHIKDATEAIGRILSFFPENRHMLIRFQLASVLSAVVCQKLVPNTAHSNIVPVSEVMINNDRIQEKIRNPDKTHHIRTVISEDHGQTGMRTFDQCLLELVEKKVIDRNTAIQNSSGHCDFSLLLEGIQPMGGNHFSAWKKSYTGLKAA